MKKKCRGYLFQSLVTVLSFGHILSSLATPAGFRWCCVSEAEVSKCLHLANVTSQIAWFRGMICIHGNNVTNCVKMVGHGTADFITLGEENIYQAGSKHDLVPVVAEDYGKQEEGLESYSVALIRSNLSEGVSMNSLKDTKSCHPAAGDSVGWTAPVGLLIGRGVIQWNGCNPYQSTGEYFDQSCVPGALSNEYNPQNSNPTGLCAICTNQKTCPRNVSERYFGYHGAYRCLTEGAGDVAFVSHLTVFQHTGVENDFNPGRDFKLLCSDGTRADVGTFQTCNLARIPSRVVMARPGGMVKSLKQWLLRLDEYCRTNPHFFQMFNSSTYGGKDLLFADSTVKLIDVKEKNTTQTWLGEEFYFALQSLSSCPEVLVASRSLTVRIEPRRTGQFISTEFISLVLTLYCCLT